MLHFFTSYINSHSDGWGEYPEQKLNRLLAENNFLLNAKRTFWDLGGKFSRKEFRILCKNLGLTETQIVLIEKRIDLENTEEAKAFWTPILELEEIDETQFCDKIILPERATTPNLKIFQNKINEAFGNINLKIYKETKNTFLFYGDKDKVTPLIWNLIYDYFLQSSK